MDDVRLTNEQTNKQNSRSPCYMQPGYSVARKPVVLLERCIELALGHQDDAGRAAADQGEAEEFRLGLFFLAEAQFYSTLVPNRMLRIRAYEPYVIVLMKRCVEFGVRFGLQHSREGRKGFLVRVNSVTPFPDTRFYRHLLVECFIEGLYELKGEPQEDDGLYYGMASEINSRTNISSPLLAPLTEQVKEAFHKVVDERLSPSEVSLVFEDTYSGVVRVIPNDPVTLSFMVLECLIVPQDMQDVLYEPDVVKRLQQCLVLLKRPMDQIEFKRLKYMGRFSLRPFGALDISRNLMFASGLAVLAVVTLGGFESLMQLRRAS